MECAIKRSIRRRGKAFAVNLIAHDNIAEAERPRRADFRRTVQKGTSELSESEARPAAACFYDVAQRAQASNAPAHREPAPARGGKGGMRGALLPAPSGAGSRCAEAFPANTLYETSQKHAAAGRASRIRAQLRRSFLNRAAEVGPAGPLRLYKVVVRDQIHSKRFSLPVNAPLYRALH